MDRDQLNVAVRDALAERAEPVSRLEAISVRRFVRPKARSPTG
ncbi:hypothetical protein QTA57_07985 [Fontisubflavum oceani]|nr:hypothetical protein [Fontisubflavum oceani]WJY23003.1 hypothetical protein QTA57_07985 [Fontisubflavum oceani]